MTVDLSGLLRSHWPHRAPVTLAAVDRDGVVASAALGTWPGGRTVLPDDAFYVGSLAKQVTGAAAALLVRDSRLDADLPVNIYMPGLPAWAAAITARQLAHHVAGLPPAGELEARLGAGDWTTARVMHGLKTLTTLSHPPGTTHSYSNAGYVLLARIVEAIHGQAFATVAAERLFAGGPTGMRFVTGADASLPQMALLGPSRPLSTGDGGLWSSAPDFALWLHLMNIDALAVEPIVTARFRLSDGRSVDYGWGIGLRRLGAHPLYSHGGSWPGAVARAVRVPALGIGVAAMAAHDDAGALSALVEAVLATSLGKPM